MSTDTLYRKGEFVTNKRIPGSVYIVHIVGVLGDFRGGGDGYLLKALHNHNVYIAVDDHILDFYYTRLSEEDIPLILLSSLLEEP